MDKMIFSIGAFAVVIGLIIIGISFQQKKKEVSNYAPIIKEVNQQIVILKKLNHSELEFYNTQLKDSTINLKKRIEQSLGINAISNIKIESYNRLVNNQGLQTIISDLESLKLQLKNK